MLRVWNIIELTVLMDECMFLIWCPHTCTGQSYAESCSQQYKVGFCTEAMQQWLPHVLVQKGCMCKSAKEHPQQLRLVSGSP